MPVIKKNPKNSAHPDLPIYLLQIIITASFNCILHQNPLFSYVCFSMQIYRLVSPYLALRLLFRPIHKYVRIF